MESLDFGPFVDFLYAAAQWLAPLLPAPASTPVVWADVSEVVGWLLGYVSALDYFMDLPALVAVLSVAFYLESGMHVYGLVLMVRRLFPWPWWATPAAAAGVLVAVAVAV
ncbi:MAG TPA: hypothetical protein VFS21_40290 [Roseiflexaceae bacterium]|nr:hypothetical protein [Roseiflexaceae bacterium]